MARFNKYFKGNQYHFKISAPWSTWSSYGASYGLGTGYKNNFHKMYK